MPLDDSKISEVQKHFQALSAVASSLNAASDALTKVVSSLDESLKKLNVGITAWVIFRSRSSEFSDPGDYDEDQIGYSKVKGTWGIALRHIWGNTNFHDFSCEGPWLFNDAPRDMRVVGVDKIPMLIEELSERASDTTKEVLEKTEEVRKLASAINQMANAEQPATNPAPPPYQRKTVSPAQPPPYAKRQTPASMSEPPTDPTPLTSPFQPVPQIEALGELARGKKGGK